MQPRLPFPPCSAPPPQHFGYEQRFAKEAPAEAASPGQGIACHRCDGDPFIPEVKVNHSVTGAPNRSVGKQDITGQSAELGPKNAVRLAAVLEQALPPSQPTIEGQNQLRPKWPRMAVCSRPILNATRRKCPKCPRVVPSVENRQMASG